MSMAAGDTSERYNLVRRLGAGGFGTVYLAHDLFLDENVAVKMPIHEFPDLLSSLHEPRLLHRVRNPNIVELRDIERIQGQICLVMEFIGGGSVRDRMGSFGRGNRLPQDFAVGIAKGILNALVTAHELGVLHRDIKPDNVMITEAGVAKVTDFGIARIVEGTSSVERTMQPAGTLVYMSPESFMGEIAASTDLWATSAMLYEMVTGFPPFRGRSTGEIMKNIMTSKPDQARSLNPEVSAVLEAVLYKALQRDPVLRFPSARALLEALESIPASAGDAPATIAEWKPESEDATPTAERIEVIVERAKDEDLEPLLGRIRERIAAVPDDPAAHRAMGDALRRLGREAEAYEAYERAFIHDRTDRAAAEGLADLGIRLRRPERTVEALIALCEIEPRNEGFHHRLALAFEQKGERARALAHMKRAIHLEPDDARAKRILRRWEEGMKSSRVE